MPESTGRMLLKRRFSCGHARRVATRGQFVSLVPVLATGTWSGCEPHGYGLQPAMELLAGIFTAKHEDVEDMVRSRLAEKTWREEGGWPATFSLYE